MPTRQTDSYIILTHHLADGQRILFHDARIIVSVGYWTPDDLGYREVEFRASLPPEAIIQKFTVAREGEVDD